MTSIKVMAGMVTGLVLGGCSSAPLGPEPTSESVTSIQEEVSLNAEMSQKMRLISRLYVSDYAALEWYQPAVGVIAFSVIQPGGSELIDNDSLKALTPTQVFRKFARNLEVPKALVTLEAHPEVLQELQDKDAVETFLPEADVQHLGLMPQTAFRISQSHAAFNCSFANFQNAVCLDNNWDFTECGPDFTGQIGPLMRPSVQESQTTVCSKIGTSQMRVDVNGCQTLGGSAEPANRCSNNFVFGAGSFFDVSPGFLRSWHGRAQTYFGIDDAYDHTFTARPKTAGAMFHVGNRVFWD